MDNFNLTLSIASLAISIIALYLSHRNNKVNRGSFIINRGEYRASSISLEFICSKQCDGYYILKFVIFNPSPIATIIKSFSVWENILHKNELLNFFNMSFWERIECAKWFPSNEDFCYKIGSLEENYINLFVKNHKNIFVYIPGRIRRDSLKFIIKTNNGNVSLQTSIDATVKNFPFDFHQEFKDK